MNDGEDLTGGREDNGFGRGERRKSSCISISRWEKGQSVASNFKIGPKGKGFDSILDETTENVNRGEMRGRHRVCRYPKSRTFHREGMCCV